MFDNKKETLRLYKDILSTMQLEYDFKKKYNELYEKLENFTEDYYDDWCQNNTDSNCTRHCPFNYICESKDYELNENQLEILIKKYEDKIISLEKEIDLESTKHCCENCKNILLEVTAPDSLSKGFFINKYCKILGIKLENPRKSVCDKFDLIEKYKDEIQDIEKIYNFRTIE